MERVMRLPESRRRPRRSIHTVKPPAKINSPIPTAARRRTSAPEFSGPGEATAPAWEMAGAGAAGAEFGTLDPTVSFGAGDALLADCGWGVVNGRFVVPLAAIKADGGACVAG